MHPELHPNITDILAVCSCIMALETNDFYFFRCIIRSSYSILLAGYTCYYFHIMIMELYHTQQLVILFHTPRLLRS
jgi:hypothetical protein